MLLAEGTSQAFKFYSYISTAASHQKERYNIHTYVTHKFTYVYSFICVRDECVRASHSILFGRANEI